MSFVFRLSREDGAAGPSVVFEDSSSPGLIPLWDALGVYDALYNADGKQAREISRAIAFAADRLADDARLAGLVPPTASVGEAIRFLQNVLRACTIHASARIQTR